MHEPPPDDTSTRDGSWQSGAFTVAWQGRFRATGWMIDCALSLGETASRCELTPDMPRQRFKLADGDQEVSGVLLARDTPHDRCLLLEMDWHDGPVREHAQTLCTWRACDPCSDVQPSRGSRALGERGQIEASWTIAGAAQACLEIEITLAGGQDQETIRLSPRQPGWQGNVRHADGSSPVTLQLRIDDYGTARLEAVCSLMPAGEKRVLDRFVLDTAAADIPAPPWPEQGVALERPRAFSSFVYPRGLLPPTPDQWTRRFVPIGNDSDFQHALHALPTEGKRQAMQAEAAEFMATPSQKYPDQYLPDLDVLGSPMAQLGGESARGVLSMPADSVATLQSALSELLGESVAAFVGSTDFSAQQIRLQNSLLALLLVNSAPPGLPEAIGQALKICHLAVALTEPSGQTLSPHALQDLQQASLLLPTALTPPPDAEDPDGYARPLGFADIRLIRQHLLRYRLGEVAHIENVMRGEALERSEEISRRIETSERDSQSNDDQTERAAIRQGDTQQEQDSQTGPLGTLKREFDNLKQEYGSDGLSVTATGAWTENLTGPATLDKQAFRYAQRLLEQASARVARKVETERSRRTVEEFIERNRRHFDNLAGSDPLIGVYRWVDAIHRVEVVPDGTRLIVEIVLADPARAYVNRSNALHGIDVPPPIPPWLGGDGIAPVLSPNDINRDNHAALAARYNTALPPAPPPLNLVRTASLAANPPQNQACVEIPPGYIVAGGTIGYGWIAPTTATEPAPALDILLGGTVVHIDPAQDPVPGSKSLDAMPAGTQQVPVTVLSGRLDFAVQVSLNCTCPADSHGYQQWQIAVYNDIMAAYGARRAEYLTTLTALAARIARPAGADAPRDVAAAELQKTAIACLIAPVLRHIPDSAPAWWRDAAIMALTQRFRDALEWQDSICTYFPRFFSDNDAQRPDWLTLARTPDSAPGFTEFLEAGGARLLVPVRPHAILPLLYYLSTGGLSWPGGDATAPVCETDGKLANTFKSIAQCPPPAAQTESWEMVIPTSMLMLQADARLPDLSGKTERES